MSQSPFASPSWEPRFAVDHSSEAAMRNVVDLWALSTNLYSLDAITHATAEPARLVLAHPRHARGEPLAKPIALPALAAYIMAWLATATYPARPNFDGSERRGFSAFVNYYGSGLDGSYDGLIVEPKWFEIHK